MKQRLHLFTDAIALVLAGLVLAPSIAGARARVFEVVPGRGIAYGFYSFTCGAPGLFPGTPVALLAPPGTPSIFNSVVLSPAGCPGSAAIMTAAIPAPGAAWALGRVIGAGSAGLVAKLPSMSATTPDTLEDSLSVSVNRGVPGQVTITIRGHAKHLNPVAAVNGAISKLRVLVYPDTRRATSPWAR